MSKGYHTTWRIPDDHRESLTYIEAGAAIALGQAVYDRRIELGIDRGELARRADMNTADIEHIEGGATVPTLRLLRTLAEALDAKLDLSIDPEETHVEFTPHPA
ncbi:helix-turn-helix domain-containing protein [Streptomyces gobiensis]|uniref:helix-turn-helix domain-containing protein n=1 Tax=Streptomyces gobiensis TaxID=2875706 RepID=UPI001E49F2E2|nr:helix-turn-helix transcriptional regulator [Streptomyces gobiensis]UGY93537.1 helix-turn-helix domain-containing protein [Streptomyces gobiensis]